MHISGHSVMSYPVRSWKAVRFRTAGAARHKEKLIASGCREQGICETIKGADVVRLINEADRCDKPENSGQKILAMLGLRLARVGVTQRSGLSREFRVWAHSKEGCARGKEKRKEKKCSGKKRKPANDLSRAIKLVWATSGKGFYPEPANRSTAEYSTNDSISLNP